MHAWVLPCPEAQAWDACVCFDWGLAAVADTYKSQGCRCSGRTHKGKDFRCIMSQKIFEPKNQSWVVVVVGGKGSGHWQWSTMTWLTLDYVDIMNMKFVFELE